MKAAAVVGLIVCIVADAGVITVFIQSQWEIWYNGWSDLSEMFLIGIVCGILLLVMIGIFSLLSVYIVVEGIIK